MITYTGSDPCWNRVFNDIKRKRSDLFEKDIHISINTLNYVHGKKNILWLVEAYPIIESVCDYIKNNNEQISKTYSKVYSYLDEFKSLEFVVNTHPSMSSWIEEPKFLPKKTKDISFISSNKNLFVGHKIRTSLIHKLVRDKNFKNIDIYGRGIFENFGIGREIPTKEEGLVDYRFSIAIENDNSDGWYTEKILDCFLTCTVPIYWGSKQIETIFNPDGILWLTDDFDFNSLNEQKYHKMKNAIVENYYIAKKENVKLEETLIKLIEEN